MYDNIYLRTTELCPIYSYTLPCCQSCKTSKTWKIKHISNLVAISARHNVICTSLPITFSITQWEVSCDACFPFWCKNWCFVGTHSEQSRIQSPPPPTTQIHFSPSLPLFLTHRACLLVQEAVCSAYFNMNIIILYLGAIRFSCHKLTQASSFYSWTLWDNITFIFSLKLKCHYVTKKKEKDWGALQHLFLMALKKDMRGESIFDLCHSA